MATGVAAIDPQALGVDHPCAPARPNDAHGSVAIVHISGPLTNEPQAAGFDTYGAILGRFNEALAAKPSALVLDIGSPGGDVAGCFDAAREMRRKAEAAGVQLVAFSGSSACSAAYALACAADTIVCSDVATLGSIGVIVQPVDVTAADAAMGLRVATITSGERKADGNPHTPLTPEGRAAIERLVASMARVFFEHVGASRPSLSAAGAEALQAAVCVGHDAVETGLADAVMSLSQLLEELDDGAPESGTEDEEQDDDSADEGEADEADADEDDADDDTEESEPDEDSAPDDNEDPPARPALAFRGLRAAPLLPKACMTLSKSPVALDLAQRFRSLVAGGISPDLAREECARQAEAAAASFRSQVAKPAAPKAAAAKPAPAAPWERNLVSRVAAQAAHFNAYVAAGNKAESWHPDMANLPPMPGAPSVASAPVIDELAALEARLGIARPGASVVVQGARQQFGVSQAATTLTNEEQQRELDRQMGMPQATAGVVVRGSLQQFGVAG